MNIVLCNGKGESGMKRIAAYTLMAGLLLSGCAKTDKCPACGGKATSVEPMQSGSRANPTLWNAFKCEQGHTWNDANR
jgi:hypothetical protein